MPQITITGQMRLLNGALLPNKVCVLRRDPLSLLGAGSIGYVPEPETITSDGAGNVSFTIESGRYVGEVSTAAGPVSFGFDVDDTPAAQSFGDCLAVLPSTSHAMVAAALILARLPFYETRIAAHVDTTLASGATFLTPDPNGVKGLMVYSKTPMGGGIFTSTPIQPVFPSQFIPPGSLGAPGLAVDGDADTGLYSPAANQLAGAAGGVLGWLLSATGLQVNLPLTGTAVTQTALDSTLQRLLKVGDGGINQLGGVNYLADVDSGTIPQGLWQTQDGGTPTLGTFPAGQNRFGHLLSLRVGAAETWQVFKSIVGRRIFSRARTAGAWSAWEEIYHAGSILGTVSQSGGVPTGRVIERGSNANGEFVRFADGTQICTQAFSQSLAIDVAFLGGFRSAAQTWTFPAAFAAAPRFIPSVRNLTAFGAVAANDPTTTAVQWAVTAVATQAAATRSGGLTAIGRWF